MSTFLAIIVLIGSFTLLPFNQAQGTNAQIITSATSGGEMLVISMDRLQKFANRFGLSPREMDVLTFLARGRNVKHIANKLSISEHTAKAHVQRIYRKTGVHSQQDLIDIIDQIETS